MRARKFLYLKGLRPELVNSDGPAFIELEALLEEYGAHRQELGERLMRKKSESLVPGLFELGEVKAFFIIGQGVKAMLRPRLVWGAVWHYILAETRADIRDEAHARRKFGIIEAFKRKFNGHKKNN